ncbi:MAG: 4Fe-4S dicluster domain-containing protein [Lachnospiraceae bacterium]|nr:4Fe-4S dicluster domain-containing protein [Lachnospiraceae bacterium]
MQRIIDKIQELFANDTVDRVLGWKTGEFSWERTPHVFTKEGGLDGFVYDDFCGANLSKYLIDESAKKDAGKVLVLLKPCDTYSYNQLIKEHRVKPENIYVLAIPCRGKVNVDAVKAAVGTTVLAVEETEGDDLKVKTFRGEKIVNRNDVLFEKCQVCQKTHQVYDEIIEAEPYERPKKDRFAEVEALEALSPEERYEFWRTQLSKCIRCNACRNVCPACNCRTCVFDNAKSGVATKANTDDFEENMFHIIRAFHVAGRCTDCGECSRVCPQNIPLHLLNRKYIKDMNTYYGEYQAGEDAETRGPLTNFTKEDVEPSIVYGKGGK